MDKMMFWSKRRSQNEKQRRAREEENLKQMFFQLPAELRNHIYELVIPSGQEIVKRRIYNTVRGWPGGLPALLQVCRFLREETYPIFYGTNRVIVVLEDLMMHHKSRNRIRSCVTLLPSKGTACWRNVRIESCARCFHGNFARQPTVIAVIDRNEGTLTCSPKYARFLESCCQNAAIKYSNRFSAIIKSTGFLDGNRKLRREDFERLMRQMDENRKDWPMSSRRVVPRYFVD